MKAIFLNVSLFISSALSFSDIYSIHITTIDGQDKAMQDFQGKRILITVIPVTKTKSDSAFLRNIDSTSRNYSAELSVIAVPSVEDGYVAGNQADLATYYRGILGSQVTITTGMYTRKQSAKQDQLFAWLTHSGQNTHFDMDVSGAGQKFFVNAQGELYGVAVPGGTLSAKLMQKLTH